MTHLVTALMPEALATRLADALMEGEHHLDVAAAGAFEQAPPDWRFEAWFEAAPDGSDWTATVRRLLGPVADAVRFEHKTVDATDWGAKSLDDLPPVRVGRFVVHGAHDRAKVRANEIGIEIEASMAFGTGHHATTAGCLAALDVWAKRARVAARKGPRRRSPAMLDVGTGTGVLAIGAARATRIRAVAGDNDREAVRIARENARAAGVAGLVTVVEAWGTKHPAMRARAPYELVVANILIGPLIAIASELAAVAAPRGTLVLSGLLAWQAHAVEAAYLARGFRRVRRRLIGDWATLTLSAATALPARLGRARIRRSTGSW
jgi:ribosomal protein L11 methyltransferase